MIRCRPRVLNPNGISIGSAVFAGLTSMTRQTDRLTDHTTRSVTIGRIYMHSTAMWPNNVHILSNTMRTRWTKYNEQKETNKTTIFVLFIRCFNALLLQLFMISIPTQYY